MIDHHPSPKSGNVSILVYIAALFAGLLACASAAAQDNTGEYDCTVITFDDDASGRLLTRAERLAALDSAFFDSLDQYDACQAEKMASGSSGSGSGSGAGAGAGNSGAGASGAGDSVATSSIRGTESLANTEESRAARDLSLADPEATAMPPDGLEQDTDIRSPGSTGSVPEDIPPADNDTAVAAIMRDLAMKETDPERRAELWNAYRRYQNIPVQEEQE